MKKILLTLTLLATMSLASEVDLTFKSAKTLAEGKDMYTKMNNYTVFTYTKGGEKYHTLLKSSERKYFKYNSKLTQKESTEEDFEAVNEFHGGLTGVVSKNGGVFLKSKDNGFSFMSFESEEAYNKYNIENVKEYTTYINDVEKGCMNAEEDLMKNGSLIWGYFNKYPHDYVINGDTMEISLLLEDSNWHTFTLFRTKVACEASKGK